MAPRVRDERALQGRGPGRLSSAVALLRGPRRRPQEASDGPVLLWAIIGQHAESGLYSSLGPKSWQRRGCRVGRIFISQPHTGLKGQKTHHIPCLRRTLESALSVHSFFLHPFVRHFRQSLPPGCWGARAVRCRGQDAASGWQLGKWPLWGQALFSCKHLMTVIGIQRQKWLTFFDTQIVFFETLIKSQFVLSPSPCGDGPFYGYFGSEFLYKKHAYSEFFLN